MPSLNKKTGAQIAIERKRRGWSQDDLAAQSGQTQNMISRAENGKGLDVERTDAIAGALGLTVGELVGRARAIVWPEDEAEDEEPVAA